LQKTLAEIEDHFEKYRLSDALLAIYKLVWDDFCSWFLELIKPTFGQPIDQTTFNAAIHLLEQNLKLLHPFMPFLSEEIWQYIVDRPADEALIVSTWPEQKVFDQSLIEAFETTTEVIANIRTIRKDKNIPFKEALSLMVLNNDGLSHTFDAVIQKLTNVAEITYVKDSVSGALAFRVNANEYFIPLGQTIDLEAERAKLDEELKYLQGFLRSVQGKLSNEKFVNGAPEQVLANERKKEADTMAKIATIEAGLKNLG